MAAAAIGDGQRISPSKQEKDLQNHGIVASTRINGNPVEISVRYYELDKIEAIRKKLIAADKKDFDVFINKEGRCILVEFSTAAYEIFLLRLKDHYMHDIKQKRACIKEGRDAQQNLVDCTLKMKKRGHVYTINCYNTTSSAMINGENYQTFIPVLKEIMSTMPHPEKLHECNEILKISLQDVLCSPPPSWKTIKPASYSAAPKGSPHFTPGKRCSSRRGRGMKLQDMLRSPKSVALSPECLVCNDPVGFSSSVQCNTCSRLIHKKCKEKCGNSNLNGNFTCILCHFENAMNDKEDNIINKFTVMKEFQEESRVNPLPFGIKNNNKSADNSSNTCNSIALIQDEQVESTPPKNKEVKKHQHNSSSTEEGGNSAHSPVLALPPPPHLTERRNDAANDTHDTSADSMGTNNQSPSKTDYQVAILSPNSPPQNRATQVTHGTTGVQPSGHNLPRVNLPLPSTHTEKTIDVRPKTTSTDPPAVDLAKELKAREKNLKKWETNLQKQALELAEVTKELAAARILVERFEYESRS